MSTPAQPPDSLVYLRRAGRSQLVIGIALLVFALFVVVVTALVSQFPIGILRVPTPGATPFKVLSWIFLVIAALIAIVTIVAGVIFIRMSSALSRMNPDARPDRVSLRVTHVSFDSFTRRRTSNFGRRLRTTSLIVFDVVVETSASAELPIGTKLRLTGQSAVATPPIPQPLVHLEAVPADGPSTRVGKRRMIVVRFDQWSPWFVMGYKAATSAPGAPSSL